NTGLLMSVAMVLGTLFNTAIAQDQNAQTAGKLAGQISASLMQIIKQAEDRASQTDAMHEKSATVAISELKRLAEDIYILERLLRNGKSLDQTLPHYESIAFRRKNVRFFAEGIEIKESIRKNARATGELLDQLDRIYN
ncbi:MAG: hypothetical protein P8Y12_03925, partial [Gammaproteobacteria bacterium]